MRNKQIVVDPVEDIVSYECNYTGKFVRILVGTGVVDSLGNFVSSKNQNYECLLLNNEEFDQLMEPLGNKPKGTFRKEDLWPFVDSIRAHNALANANPTSVTVR